MKRKKIATKIQPLKPNTYFRFNELEKKGYKLTKMPAPLGCRIFIHGTTLNLLLARITGDFYTVIEEKSGQSQ